MTGKAGTQGDTRQPRECIVITGSMITPVWLLLFLAVLASLGGMFLLGLIWHPDCTLISYAAHGGPGCH